MKLLKSRSIIITICLSAASCSKDHNNSNHVEITGTIQKQGFITYQYETHTISGYALRSCSVNLDDFIN